MRRMMLLALWSRHSVLAVVAVGVLLGVACSDEGASPADAGQILFTRAPFDQSDPLGWQADSFDLYTIGPDGSNLRLFVRNAYEASVAPDARQIAFGREGTIWLMRRDGSGQRQHTTTA